MRTLVTGATGFIGRHLLEEIEDAVVLTRDPERARGLPRDPEVMAWSPRSGPPPPAAFAEVDVVFHLAGEPIAGGRWTAERKRRILESRREGTRALVDGIAAASPRPRVLVSSSAVGFYGDRGEERLTEASPAGTGFLAQVAVDWENESRRAESLGVRTVRVRTGVVLGTDGGMLARIQTPFRFGLGATLGSGRQWMPWIHRIDIVRLFLHAAAAPGVPGALNGVAPGIVRNRELTKLLARVLGRPAILRVPAFAMKALLGEMAEVVLGSQRADPEATLASGFAFAHPDLEGALRDLLR